MSPVEPSPLVMGTMGAPSTEGIDDLVFLPKIPAAFNSAGASRPPKAAPSAATKERRLQSNFKFTIFSSQLGRSGSLTKDGCPISRSFFARCGIPLLFPSDSRFIRCTERSTSVESHISRKTSEIWGTRPLWGNQRTYRGAGLNLLFSRHDGRSRGLLQQADRVRVAQLR